MWISFNNSIHCMRIEKKCHVLFWLLWLKIQMHAWNFILPSRKVHIPAHESAYPKAWKYILSSINRDRESSNQINFVQMFSHLIQIICLNISHTYYSDTKFLMKKKNGNVIMPFENKYNDCMNILRVWIPLFSIETFLIKINS